MAKRKPETEMELTVADDAVVESPAVVEESPSPESVYSPDTHVCLDGAYVAREDAAEKPRRLIVGGTNYEHTHEDAAGVWCYRSM